MPDHQLFILECDYLCDHHHPIVTLLRQRTQAGKCPVKYTETYTCVGSVIITLPTHVYGLYVLVDYVYTSFLQM